MKINDLLKNPVLKKGMGIVSIVFTGLVAVTGALADKQREKEFEEMKKDIETLKSERGES